MDDTYKIIIDLGGVKKASDLLGVSISRVSNWHVRGIPWRWRPAVASLAAEKGVVVPTDFLITDRKVA